MFHVSIWGGLELCLWGLSPQKPPCGDGTGRNPMCNSYELEKLHRTELFIAVICSPEPEPKVAKMFKPLTNMIQSKSGEAEIIIRNPSKYQNATRFKLNPNPIACWSLVIFGHVKEKEVLQGWATLVEMTENEREAWNGNCFHKT